mmetsp:Transcript_41569/g.120351  ORF Transcript_41569/g.120351 Transcript_41569/m.120351 type:complete len:302 (+) Transcript_41569:688-1593(+)
MVLRHQPVCWQIFNLLNQLPHARPVAVDEHVAETEAAVVVRGRGLQPLQAVHDLHRADEDLALHGHLQRLPALLQLLGGVHLVGRGCDDAPLLRKDVVVSGDLVLRQLLQPPHGPRVQLLRHRRQGHGRAPAGRGVAGLGQEPGGHRHAAAVAGDLMPQDVRTQDDHAAREAPQLHALYLLVGARVLVHRHRKVAHLQLRLRRSQELDDHEPVPHELLQPEGRHALRHGRGRALVVDTDFVQHARRPPGHLKAQLWQLVLQQHAHGRGHLVELSHRGALCEVSIRVEGVHGGRALPAQKPV